MFSLARSDRRRLRSSTKQSSRRELRSKSFTNRSLLLEQLEARTVLSASAMIDPTGGQLAIDSQSYDPGSIVVRFRPGAAALNAADVVRGASNGRAFSSVPGLRVVKLGHGVGVEAALHAFRSNPNVLYAEPNFHVRTLATPNDPSYSALYGLNNTGQTGGLADADIDAPEAWDITTGDGSIVVGVIDTGVDYTHPDLAANMWTNPGEIPDNNIDDEGNGFIDDVHGYNFVSYNGNSIDDFFHGTHVAGTIGAVGNNGIGVTGVNWNVQIMSLKFLDSGGGGYISDAVAAVDYATMMRNLWLSSGGTMGANIRLTSNSWGGGGYDQALLDAINAGGDAGIMFVAAAGNDGSDADSFPMYPAAYESDNIISVAATDSGDNLAYFSNWGLNSVDVGAPGVDIYSTFPTYVTDAMFYNGFNTDYETISGTSMATPHVSGVAALAWSLNPSATVAEIRAAILGNVDPIAALDTSCPTPVATGGRLNAHKTLQALGMAVAGSTPAAGSIVGAAPVDFVINFSHPYDEATVDAGDLTVNGVAATSRTLTDSDTVTFHFGASPITVQGLQTMHISAGALAAAGSAGLPDPAIHEWTASFRYDLLTMAVTSTEPADGSAVTLPLGTLKVHLNEPVLASSIQTGDLVISQGSVESAGLDPADITGKTILFGLSGILSEGTLSASIAAGTLTDEFGNPNLAYSSSYTLDIGTIPYATPLVPITPLGSLIYDPLMSGIIQPATDTDSFTINVDAGQTITVIVNPSDTLQPTVALSGPLAGGATSPGLGKEIVLQTVGITPAGLYTVTVGSAAGTGPYTVQVILNAAVELESHDGSGNSTPATAQNIDTSFTPLLKGATRGAVLGRTDATNPIIPVYTANFESGNDGFATTGQWHQSIGHGSEGGHSPTHSMYFGTGEKYAQKGRGPITFTKGTYELKSKGKVQTTAGTITSPNINLPTGGQLSVDFNYILQTQGSTTLDLAQLQIKPTSSSTWTTLASYNGVAESNLWRAADPVDVSAYAGQAVQLRFNFDTVNGQQNNFEGWYVDDVRVRQSVQHDMYSFTVPSSQHVTVALQSAGDVNVLLQNAAGTTTLAAGVPGAVNVSKMIYNYSLPAGTYNLAVSGQTNTPYTLVVLRDAVFDREVNDSSDNAQPLGDTHVALGSLSNGETVTLNAFDSGWWDATGFHDEFNDNYVTALLSGLEYRDFFVFDLSGVAQQIAAAELRVFNPYDGFFSPDPTETYSLFDVSTPLGSLEASGGGQTAIFNDLGTGTNYGSQVVSPADNGQFVSVSLNSAGLAALNASLGGQTALGGALTSLSGEADQYLFGYSGQDSRQLVITLADPADWYSFTAVAGSTILLNTATPGDGAGEPGNTLNPRIELYFNNALVASGVPMLDGRNEDISYLVPGGAGGTYKVKVTAQGGTAGDYILDPISTSPAPSALPLLVAGSTRPKAPATGSTVAPIANVGASSLKGASLSALSAANVDRALATIGHSDDRDLYHTRSKSEVEPELLEKLASSVASAMKASLKRKR
jgi:subtilisin family serine protease